MIEKLKNNRWLYLYIGIVIIIGVILGFTSYLVYNNNLKKEPINNNINNSDNNNDIVENEPVDNNTQEMIGEELSTIEINELNTYFNDLLNSQMAYINFSSPSDLLNDLDGYLDYIVSRSKYAIEIPDEHIPISSITLEEIKRVLKELTNYDYSDKEIKEYFKTHYDEKENKYIFLGGGAGGISSIISSYKIDNKYYVELSNESNVVLEKINNKYYFYSCQVKEFDD